MCGWLLVFVVVVAVAVSVASCECFLRLVRRVDLLTYGATTFLNVVWLIGGEGGHTTRQVS